MDRTEVNPSVVADAEALASLISYAITAHATQAKKPKNATRRWDHQTPYSVHPVWCAMTILQETTLPEDVRRNGAQALLLHDIIEDTRAGLPEGTDPQVSRLVEDMTFEGIDQEREQVWSRGNQVLLLKLYDKVSNLLDGRAMYPDRKVLYVAYTRKLIVAVREAYGELNIVAIAEAICSQRGEP